VAKLKRKRAGISSGNITEVMNAAEAAAESGADQKYIDNPYNKELDETINKAVDEAKSNRRKVEAADYADSKRDNPIKNLDQDTQEYARKYKDATIEPILSPELQVKLKSEKEYESHPELLPVVLPSPPGSSSGAKSKKSAWDSAKQKFSSAASGAKESAGNAFSKAMKFNNKTVGGEKVKPDEVDLNKFERDLKVSDSRADYLASLCGHTKSIKTLRFELQEYYDKRDKLEREVSVFDDAISEGKNKIKELEDEYYQLQMENNILSSKKVADDEDKNTITKNQKRMLAITHEIEDVRKIAQQSTGTNRYNLGLKQRKIDNELEAIKSDFSKYYQAVTCGNEKDQKAHGWRNFAKEFGDNTTEMLGNVNINPVTDIVSYGGMTGKSAVAGIDAITGGYKIRDTANSWTRTNVGDRQLVESLVNVRPNRMITPFGVPGTVGESNLQHQFQYSSPLRRIDVGDVTAHGGYQLRLEDIHRKRKKSQPKIVRKKIVEKKIIEKKKVMGTNKALINAMATVRNQRLVDIKVPTIGIKNVKGASGEPSIKGIVVLNNAKESALSKTTLNFEMKGIKNIMVNAVNMTSKRAKPKKVKK